MTTIEKHLDTEDPHETSTTDSLPLKPALTKVLRWGGGVLLAAAAVAFMFQGVYSFAPMTRHWIMLAVCSLLGLLGIFTGIVLKEEKGARAFLGLAAASFPVIASQLGAMFFSLFGSPPANMPQPLVFSLATSSTVIATAGLSLAIMTTVSYVAFRILARSRAGLLTGIFTWANLCILAPVRDDIWIGIIILIVAASIYWADNARLMRDFRLYSFEGRVARLMLTGPLGVIVGRTFFYPVGPAFYGLLLAMTGAYLTFHWGRVTKRADIRKMFQVVGAVGMTAGWLTGFLPNICSFVWGEGLTACCILLPVAAILGTVSFVAENQTAATYRSAGAVVALAGVALAHSVEAAPMVSIVGVVVAAATLLAGTLAGEKLVFTCGMLTATVSLGNFILQAVRMHSGYAWLALALIGIGVMLSASLIEKGLARSVGTLSLWGRFKA